MPRPQSETGFKIDLSELSRSGVQLNKFDKGIPFWKSVDGLQFTPSAFKRKPGRSLIVDLGAEPIRGIIAINEFGTKVAYAGDLSNLYSYRLDTDTTDTVGTGYSLIEKAGFSVWDSGSSTWDSGGSVWDEGILQASRWSFTRFGNWVLAANNIGPVQIKKNNINFNDLKSTEVSGGTVAAAGSSYAVGDTVTHTGGSGTGFTTTVTEISGGGVSAFEITNFGSGFTDGDTLTQNTTSGSGTGFTLDVTVPDAVFTRVRALARLKAHILAINYDTASVESPFDFSWCSEDNPDLWTPTSTNSAGSLTIREASTELKCVVPLGDGLAIYTEDQMFLVNYLGAPFYFGYSPVLGSGAGAVSSASVMTVDRLNYGLSKRGLFVTDGSSVTQLGVDEGISLYIRENIATTEYPQVSSFHNAIDNEVVWSMPINGAAPSEEIYYNYETGSFGLRAVTLSASFASGVFDNSLTGDTGGNLYFEGVGSSAQSTSGTTRAHDLEDADQIKELTSIRVGKRGNGIPVIEVGWSDTIDGSPTYTDSFSVNTSFIEEFLRTAGRYLFLRVTSSGVSDTWEITNIEVQGRMSGTR